MTDKQELSEMVNTTLDLIESKKQKTLFKNSTHQTVRGVVPMPNQLVNAGWASVSKSKKAVNIKLDECQNRLFTIAVSNLERLLKENIKGARISEIVQKLTPEEQKKG